MTRLSDVLHELHLGQYLAVLQDNGFGDWETVLDITEEDLRELGFKLGHRRALQRKIATYRGHASYLALRSESADGASPESAEGTGTRRDYSADNSGSDQRTPSEDAQQEQPQTGRPQKRRYRWHPRPDENAPKRPKTAYVNFSDHLRNDPTIASLGFVEIAREVGRQWQQLDPEVKHKWEREAAYKMLDWEEEMEKYKRSAPYQQYQRYLENFKKAPGKSLRKPSSQARSEATKESNLQPAAFETPPDSTLSSVTTPVLSPANGKLEEVEHALLEAILKLKQMQQYHKGPQINSLADLPSEQNAREAFNRFFMGTRVMLYTWSEKYERQLFDNVYTQRRPDSLNLAEICAGCALGAIFTSGRDAMGSMRSLYISAIANFDLHAERDYLRIARLLAILSLCGVIEKQTAARSLTAAGLKIARWQFPLLDPNDKDRDDWQGIYRTLSFIDCWLSYTLGYPSEATIYDVDNATSSDQESTLSLQIQHQATMIAMIAADIGNGITRSDNMLAGDISQYAARLDNWQRNLPESMRLTAILIAGADAKFEYRTLFVIHMLYLGAIILVYRTLIVLAEESVRLGTAWNLDVSWEQAQDYQATCVVAAQNIARIIALLDTEAAYNKRCWVVIYWSYTACSVLLFEAAQQMRHGITDGLDETLGYASDCINMLGRCSSYDNISKHYLSTLKPLHENLLQARVKMALNQAKQGLKIADLLQPHDPTRGSSADSGISFQGQYVVLPPTTTAAAAVAAALSPVVPRTPPLGRDEIGSALLKLGEVLKDPWGLKTSFQIHAMPPSPMSPGIVQCRQGWFNESGFSTGFDVAQEIR